MSEGGNKMEPSVSPARSPRGPNFLVPSPLPTRRTRTDSMTQRARAGPSHIGTVKTFCREKGHGFIQPADGTEPIFLHISDIDGDFVLKEGDEVVYHLCPVPPKMEKFSAVHVRIKHAKEGVQHERWDVPQPHQHDHK